MTNEEMLGKTEELIGNAQRPVELRRGSVYALQATEELPTEAMERLRKYLDMVSNRTNIEFIVIWHGLELTKPPC